MTTDIHVIFPSTMGVYEPSDKNLGEDSVPNPDGLYGRSKLDCESILRKKLPTITIFRIANVFGPRSFRGDLITSLIRSCLQGRKLTLQISPESERDFLYVTDVARAMVDFSIPGEILNAGSGQGIKVCQLVDIVEEVLDRKLHVEYAGQSTHDRFVLSTEKISRIGFKPQVSVERGIDETAKWIVDNLALLES
jgi:nucleoside-diphosphate-sugar epimerase